MDIRKEVRVGGDKAKHWGVILARKLLYAICIPTINKNSYLPTRKKT